MTRDFGQNLANEFFYLCILIGMVHSVPLFYDTVLRDLPAYRLILETCSQLGDF